MSEPDDSVQRKFQKELATGVVALVLLAVLARSEQALYGYQIAKQMEAGGGALGGKLSSLYPVLRNLDAAGLLDSFVEPSESGPPRRYYRITESGRSTLTGWQSRWVEAREFVDAILDTLPVDRSR
jgi:PadR family transcriptional regulator PadR